MDSQPRLLAVENCQRSVARSNDSNQLARPARDVIHSIIPSGPRRSVDTSVGRWPTDLRLTSDICARAHVGWMATRAACMLSVRGVFLAMHAACVYLGRARAPWQGWMNQGRVEAVVGGCQELCQCGEIAGRRHSDKGSVGMG